MKILISWIAYQHDFGQGKVNEEGPTYRFHRFFYEHDRHLLLSAEDTRIGFLASRLQRDFPKHQVIPQVVSVSDVINLAQIKSVVESILLEHAEHEIDIFFSPGTSAMQVAWYSCHTSLGLRTRLLQVRPPQFAQDRERGDLLEIEVNRSEVPVATVLREKPANRGASEQSGDYKMTESLQQVYERAYQVSQTDRVTVLVQGESGTGKENLARYIHRQSARQRKPFVAINCSAFSDSLLESQLFGYAKGAFTGADKDTQGLFEKAQGGTLFLDEIGDISPYMQQSLLRVLQEREIQPIGGAVRKVDVRIIAATNRDLVARCEKGEFRWDLFYRLSVAELALPTLHERGKQELLELLNFFLHQKKGQLQKRKLLKLDKKAKNALLAYHFPGNVRELENLIESLYVFCTDTVFWEDLPERIRHPNVYQQPLRWEQVEKQHIERVLQLKKGNQRQTAMAIGYSINTLKSKIKKYGIDQ